MSDPWRGLTAFPLTPMRADAPDLAAVERAVARLAAAGVDAVGALGSTGSAAYLSRDDRALVARTVIEAADGLPVLVGVSAVSTAETVRLAEDAASAGAAAVLVAPVQYQPLTGAEVIDHYAAVAAEQPLPVVLYDNPATTRFSIDNDLLAELARIPGVTAVKVPSAVIGGSLAERRDQAGRRLAAIRALIPAHVGVGMSGDAFAAPWLLAGCPAWFSVLGGTLPEVCVALTRAAAAGREAEAERLDEVLRPFWALNAAHGSLRVTAAAAEALGAAPGASLPRPLRGLDGTARTAVRAALARVREAGFLPG